MNAEPYHMVFDVTTLIVLLIFFLVIITYTSRAVTSRNNDFIFRIEFTSIVFLFARVEVAVFLTSGWYREDFIDLTLLIFIVFVIVAVYNLQDMSRSALVRAHLMVNSHEAFHIAFLKLQIVLAFVDFAKLSSTICFLFEFLWLVGCNNAGVTLESSALKH